MQGPSGHLEKLCQFLVLWEASENTHFMAVHQSQELLSLKSFAHLRGGKWCLGILTFHFLFKHWPCQISFCHFLLSELWSANSLRKVSFHGTCEYNALNISVTKSLAAFILIIMPTMNSFLSHFVIQSYQLSKAAVPWNYEHSLWQETLAVFQPRVAGEHLSHFEPTG